MYLNKWYVKGKPADQGAYAPNPMGKVKVMIPNRVYWFHLHFPKYIQWNTTLVNDKANYYGSSNLKEKCC